MQDRVTNARARNGTAGTQAPGRVSTRRYVSRITRNTLAVVMAGGRGERLKNLTDFRCKPATPFGGRFRISDFVLSNCVNSGIRRIAVMTQYKAHSLIQHIQRGWGYLRGELGEFIEVIPAQQQLGEMWYRGTADSLYQNLQIIRLHHPRHVLVLAGDHIYKMDYGPMLASHVEKKADITVGVVEVPREQASAFGVMSVDPGFRITKFSEKPRDPEGIPGREQFALGSMFTKDDIMTAAAEAMERLRAGESELAIHEGCGTNIATSTLLPGFFAFIPMSRVRSNFWRFMIIPFAVGLAVFGYFLSKPLGPCLQRNVTTEADIGGMRIVDIIPVRKGLHRVLTT